MKSIIIILMSLVIALSGCKKAAFTGSQANINVVNAVLGAETLRVNYHGEKIHWGSNTGTLGNINFGSNQLFAMFNFNSEYPFEIVYARDTTNVLFSQKLSFQSNEDYTLFVAGELSNPDGIFLKENKIPYNLLDSVIAVRFINLSSNSPNVSVTLANTPTLPESITLAYKQITSFKNYRALKVNAAGSLTFQFRDLTTNAILTTYTIPSAPASPYANVSISLSRFKSITLVIKGLVGTTTGPNAFSVFPIAHY